jgi:hypothetical protein
LFRTFPPRPFIYRANGGSALDWTKILDAALGSISILQSPAMARFRIAQAFSNFETNSRPCAIASAGWIKSPGKLLSLGRGLASRSSQWMP